MSTVNFTTCRRTFATCSSRPKRTHAPTGWTSTTTIFEVCDYDEISEIAALGGFPTRYPHWRFGMEYQQLSKGYRYGLQKIYEMVINNDPCYAYLLRCNQMVDQKLVMAHVYGHNDFFKNNIWFSQTNRKMMDEMANHGTRIRAHMDRYGEETVENFIDNCLSLENLIDIYSPHDQAARGSSTATISSPTERKSEPADAGSRARITWTRSSTRRTSSRRRRGSGRASGKRRGPSRRRSRSSRSATCCCSSSSTHR